MRAKTSIGIAFIVAGVVALIGVGVTYFQPQQMIVNGIGEAVGEVSFGKSTEIESGDLDVDFTTVKKLVVDNPIGRIHVVGTSDTQAWKLHYAKGIYGLSNDRARQNVQEYKVDVKQDGDVVKIKTTYNVSNLNFSNLYVDLELFVPAELAVELENNVGEIETQNLLGTVNVKSDVGAVHIDGFKGVVAASSRTGSLDVRGGQEIKEIDLETNVGKVSITLPEDARLKVDAQTNIGRIENDFDLPESDRHQVHANIGDGSLGKVRLKTNTGAIEINKQ
ncbi:DUF4097 family beta strand repeat-containing protein [Tumebacillus permanentifrigoris]|uniref:Putative adhesin n=1 Tax=Tumebacillus permanentifrigoris TaxID=378543 RepID=A0A316DE73_9BACL|nr:DUF4097 family beta strand repeat-containing protein [Tumebacillus permanentifrigoris]PWK15832.1 putative adhesin [Tumebacillus permanentifrigoris]